MTGAAKGLGRAFCLGLAREGARIMAVTRKDMDNLEQTVQMIRSMGGEAEMIQADVAVEEDTQAMAQETIKQIRPPRYPAQQCGHLRRDQEKALF